MRSSRHENWRPRPSGRTREPRLRFLACERNPESAPSVAITSRASSSSPLESASTAADSVQCARRHSTPRRSARFACPFERSGQRLLKIGFFHDRRKLEDTVAIGAEFELRIAVIAEYEHFLHRRNSVLREPRPYAPVIQTAHAARIERIDAQVETRDGQGTSRSGFDQCEAQPALRRARSRCCLRPDLRLQWRCRPSFCQSTTATPVRGQSSSCLDNAGGRQ